MCKVHTRRVRLDPREVRELYEDGYQEPEPSRELDIDLTIDPESGGVVIDTPVDINLSD